MFIGHFAAAFAGKRIAPEVSLGTLILAAQWLDLLWPTLLLLGVERVDIDPSLPGLTPLAFVHYPYSHSLLSVLAMAALFGGAHWLLRRNLRAAVLLGALVLSHWLLDVVVHRPDLPLLPAGPMLGLALWEHPLWAIAFELALFAAGVALYLRATPDAARGARIGFWVLVIFLLGVHAGNVFGPPPPSVEAIAWVGQAQWLLVLAGYAIDWRRSRPLPVAAH
jgi:hypothetical protein